MAATTDHPCFPQPISDDVSLWKYMDFTKFMSLITYQKIFACRSDLFDDPYEGTYPRRIVKSLQDVEGNDSGNSDAKSLRYIYDFNLNLRKHTYISCWHANNFESAAMWDLYSKNDASVAIETTYADLRNLLPPEAFIGLVNYIDYDKDIFPINNAFYPFTHKRKSFEHEREVRFLIQKIPIDVKRNRVDFDNCVAPAVISIDANINSFVKKIHLSPRAPEWMLNLLRDVIKKYSINVEVRRSNLYISPIY
ncbi:DUF2971 domain-containing protein [Dickeya dadantii]|uniref:DUF2971 domain-containing protein n=1 Tax=Dickeya dadantii TaxID=204038 RepID=UPI001495FB51|nr:DUF2971 domain-containing protein [Dickeya dadantii]NPE61196.1 DUF2971 domain-containing protein [Dickeya dadantii]NPE70379.1 DUF2971 domain-containing protein [Dickeya dadantii]